MKIELNDTVTFQVSEVTYTLKLSTLSPDYIAQILAHGAKQVTGDAAAGKAPDDRNAASRKAFDKLSAGEHAFGGGGGGKRLSLFDRCLRDTILDYCAKKGIKGEDARDAAATPQPTVVAWAKAKGSDPEKAWAMVQKQAKALADLRAQAETL